MHLFLQVKSHIYPHITLFAPNSATSKLNNVFQTTRKVVILIRFLLSYDRLLMGIDNHQPNIGEQVKIQPLLGNV